MTDTTKRFQVRLRDRGRGIHAPMYYVVIDRQDGTVFWQSEDFRANSDPEFRGEQSFMARTHADMANTPDTCGSCGRGEVPTVHARCPVCNEYREV